MALTKEQWYEKLKGFVPTWVFEESEEYSEAIFKGIAAVMRQAQVDYEDHVGETFIETSVDEFLDEHGDERSVERISGETNPPYRIRVRSIVNEADRISVKRIVDDFLVVGESEVVEDWQGNAFCDREYFVDRGVIVLIFIKDSFIIIIDDQTPAGTTPDVFFVPIVQAIKDAKGYGCLFRFLEREA